MPALLQNLSAAHGCDSGAADGVRGFRNPASGQGVRPIVEDDPSVAGTRLLILRNCGYQVQDPVMRSRH